jgi:hypothetical protein
MGHMSVLHSGVRNMLMHVKERLLVSSSLQEVPSGVYTNTHAWSFHTAFPRCRVSACILWHQHLVLPVAQSHVVLWLIRRNYHMKENTTCCGFCVEPFTNYCMSHWYVRSARWKQEIWDGWGTWHKRARDTCVQGLMGQIEGRRLGNLAIDRGIMLKWILNK